MYKLSQWQENKVLQEDYETIYRSPTFQSLKDVLIDMMLSSVPELSKEASPLEIEALRGVFQKGQQRMIENLERLRPAKILENNNPLDTNLPKTPTGLPYTPEIEKRVKAMMPKPRPPKPEEKK